MDSPDLPPAGSAPDKTSAEDPARKLVGTTIAGRYKVLSLIGEGGMGAVFLVEHAVIRKRMALKVLNAQMMKNSEAVARFEREALAAAHIDHPNVVAATDSGHTEDGALFVVFEYIDGQPLRDRLTYGPLPAPLALHIARQVAAALVRAHGMNIIHRDLKPENIMLVAREDDKNVAKVLDFGLAKLSVRALLEGEGAGSVPMSELMTRYGAVFGTPAYMAPEQAAGGEVDGRTDLYGLGVVLYEMLTGTLPFDGDDSATLLRQHVVAQVPSLRARAPAQQISAAVESFVLRLLEKRPDKRFESAKVLLEAIDALVLSEKLRYDPTALSPGVRISSSEVPRANVSSHPTALAPEDLPARRFAETESRPPADSAGAPGKPRKADSSGGESLALVLKDLNDLNRPDKSSDGLALGGLAEQFGAGAAPGGSGGPGASPPALLAKAGGAENTPPKLRAPSSIDINVLQPEAAAAPVLTPAPPPTIGERVRDASQEAVGWWRSTGQPAVQAGAEKGRTVAAVYWKQLLAYVRGRLPEKHRGISERLLGAAVGGVLALPVVILLFVLLFSGGESSSPGAGAAAMPGFATDSEMERGVSGGPKELEKLAARYPSDSRIFRALSRSHAGRKDYAAALRALSSLARLDPAMAGDDEMTQIATAAALLPETSDSAIAILETSLGDKGVGALADLVDRTTMEPWKSKLSASLQKPAVRQLASEATLVLIDLRAAPRCEDKRGLLRRAAQQGDLRTLAYLRGLQSTTGCGAGGQNDCWTCLHKGTTLQSTIDQLQKRLGG